MLEYELRLLPMIRMYYFLCVGKIRFGIRNGSLWEHEAYLEAEENGAFCPGGAERKNRKQQMEECDFIGEESMEYIKSSNRKMKTSGCGERTPFSFMMMDLDAMEKKIHSTPKRCQRSRSGKKTITAGMIQSAVSHEMKREAEERKAWFIENFDKLTLDIYASEWMRARREEKVIRELLQAGAEEEVIKSIIRPEIEEGQVLQKKKMWLEMQQCSCTLKESKLQKICVSGILV